MKQLIAFALSIVLMTIIIVGWEFEGIQGFAVGICSNIACTLWVNSWWQK